MATTKISVADKRYASTAVCLNIAHLASVKDLPSVPTAQVIILLTQKIACNGGKREKSLKKCENNLSFPEARKQFERFYQSTETDNKTTQTDDRFTEY